MPLKLVPNAAAMPATPMPMREMSRAEMAKDAYNDGVRVVKRAQKYEESAANATKEEKKTKALGKAHDATLNDVVLWLASTALRAHHQASGTLPRKSMVAAVPVSLRAKGDTTADNQASMTLLSLGTHIADDRRRLAHVRAATRSMKATLSKVKNVLPTDFPSLGLSWLTQAAASIYRRATDRLPPVANVDLSPMLLTLVLVILLVPIAELRSLAAGLF